MTRQELINEINGQVSEAIAEAKAKGECHTCTTYNTNDGWIDIWCDHNDNAEVVIQHDDRRTTNHNRLETYILDGLPRWDDVEADAEDYDDSPSPWAWYYNRL